MSTSKLQLCLLGQLLCACLAYAFRTSLLVAHYPLALRLFPVWLLFMTRFCRLSFSFLLCAPLCACLFLLFLGSIVASRHRQVGLLHQHSAAPNTPPPTSQAHCCSAPLAAFACKVYKYSSRQARPAASKQKQAAIITYIHTEYSASPAQPSPAQPSPLQLSARASFFPQSHASTSAVPTSSA